MNSKTTLIAAVIISCFASFIIGRAWPDSDKPSASANSPQLISPRARGDHHADGPANARQWNPHAKGANQMKIQVQSILSNPDSLARAKAWAQYLQGLSPEQFEDAANGLLQTGLADTSSHELSMLMGAWAMHDPLSAIAYADKENHGISIHRAVLASWAKMDPDAALEWVKDKPKSAFGRPWMLGIIQGLASTDPVRATQLLKEMPHSSDRRKAIAAVSGHYLMQGPEAARNWALSFEDKSLCQRAIDKIASSLAITDPKGTADWLLANSDKVSDVAISNVMARMAKSDPQSAIAYFNQIDASDSYRNFALRGLAMEIAKSDPQAALDLLDANANLENDRALMAIAVDNRQTNPEISNKAKERIKNPMYRAMANGDSQEGNGKSVVISQSFGDGGTMTLMGNTGSSTQFSSGDGGRSGGIIGGTFVIPGVEADTDE